MGSGRTFLEMSHPISCGSHRLLPTLVGVVFLPLMSTETFRYFSKGRSEYYSRYVYSTDSLTEAMSQSVVGH